MGSEKRKVGSRERGDREERGRGMGEGIEQCLMLLSHLLPCRTKLYCWLEETTRNVFLGPMPM